jgi:hypothetical protein
LLATDKRVVAIIHRATIGDRVDKKYAERKIEAKQRGYKWAPITLARRAIRSSKLTFFSKTVRPDKDDLLALDLESTDAAKYMSFSDARIFIQRIREKTGRYPLVYANKLVTQAISAEFGADDVFTKTPLWYARFKSSVTDFPAGTWSTYTLWQFSSEINCKADDRSACLYTVPGTEYDMDVDAYNGTIEELRARWPFAKKPHALSAPALKRSQVSALQVYSNAMGLLVARKISMKRGSFLSGSELGLCSKPDQPGSRSAPAFCKAARALS